MEPREWSRGKDLTKALDSAIPADLHVAMTDRAVTFQRMSVTERAASAFARVANTRVGLSSLLGVVALLAVWAILGGHLVVGVVLWCWRRRSAPSSGAPRPGITPALRPRLRRRPPRPGRAARRSSATAAPSPGPREVTLLGRPVLFFHGCPDTRRAARSGYDAARRLGVRLIAGNRPGYGASAPAPRRTTRRRRRAWSWRTCSGSTASPWSACRSAAPSPWPARRTTPTGSAPSHSWPPRARRPGWILRGPARRPRRRRAAVVPRAGRADRRSNVERCDRTSSPTGRGWPPRTRTTTRWPSAGRPACRRRTGCCSRTGPTADLGHRRPRGDRRAGRLPGGRRPGVPPVALRRRRGPVPGDPLVRRARRQRATAQRRAGSPTTCRTRPSTCCPGAGAPSRRACSARAGRTCWPRVSHRLVGRTGQRPTRGRCSRSTR